MVSADNLSNTSSYEYVGVYDDWSFSRIDGKLFITSYEGYEEEVYIPTKCYALDEMIYGLKESVFRGWFGKKVKKVHVPTEFEGPCQEVFKYSNVEEIVFEDGIRSIPHEICYQASCLKKVILPDSIEIIEDWAFKDSSLREILLPNGLKEIGYDAFAGVPLKMITIPNTLVTVGQHPFQDSDLEEIVFEDGIEYVPSGICSNANSLKDVVLPNSVKEIGSGAFSYTSVEEIVLSDCLERIGERAFASTGLKKIVLPASIKEIGSYAFGMTLLSEINIPNGLKKLGEGVFSSTPLKKITIPKTLETADYAFSGSRIKEVTFENGIEAIPSNFFNVPFSTNNSYPDLDIVVMPKSVKIFGDNCFGEDDSKAENWWDRPLSSFKIKKLIFEGTQNDFRKIYMGSNTNKVFYDEIVYSSFHDIYIDNEFNESQNYIFPESVYYKYENIKKDILKNVLTIQKMHDNFDIECVCVNPDNVAKYELLNNGNVILSNTTGVFDNISPNIFETNKSLEIRITGKNGDIVYVPLKIKLRDLTIGVPESISLMGEGFSMTLNEDIPLIGGDTISVDIEELPLDVSIEDGKFTIGINFIGKDEKNERQIIKEIDKSSKSKKISKGKMNDIKSFMKKHVKGQTPSIANSVEFDVIGYLEGNVDEKTATGKIIVSLSAEAKISKEFLVPIGFIVIPITAEIKTGADGNLTGQIQYNWNDKKFVGAGADFNLSGYLEPYGGIGYKDILSGGVYGKAELGTEIKILNEAPKLKKIYLDGEAGLKGYFAKAEFTHRFISMADLGKTRYKDYLSDGKLMLYADEGKSVFNSKMKYLYDTAEFTEESLESVSQFSEEETSTCNITPGKDEAIISNAYGAAKPQLVSHDGTTMMIFVDYDNTRASVNQTVIKYMVYDENTGTFSEPQIMDDDGTADCEPFVYSDDTGIYCAFLNSNKEYLEEETPEIQEYLSTFGVTVCKYDNNSFNNLGTFQVGGKYCYKPIIYRNNAGVTVSWVENEDNAIFGLSNNNSIYSVNLEGITAEPYEMATGLPCVSCIAGGIINNQDQLVYCVDSDNDLSTDKQQAFYVCDGVSTEFISGDIAGVQLVKLPNKSDNVLVYTEEGTFKVKENFDSDSENITEDVIIGVSSYQIDGNTIFYLTTNEETRNIGALIWNGNSWNNTYLTESNEYIDSFAVCGDKTVYLETKAELDSETNAIKTTSSIYKLDTLKVCRGNLDYIEFEPECIEPGKELPLTMYVTNQGTTTIESLRFVFSNKSNSNFDSAIIKDVTIAPGGTKEVEVMLSVPTDCSCLKYDVEVYDNGENSDNCLLGETYELELGLTDISVDTEYISKETHQKPVLNTIVTNESSVPANVTTVVTDSDGNVLMTEEECIEAGKAVTYILNVENIIPTDGSYKVLTATVTSDVEEFYDYNNTSSQSIFDMGTAEIEAESVDENGNISGFRGNLCWNITPDGVATLSKDIVIPASLWVDDRAENITKIIVSQDVDKIEAEAFVNCCSLQNIVIENPECEIEENALPLDVVVIADSDSAVHDYAINNGFSFADINATNSVYAVSVTLKDDIGLNFFMNFTDEILEDDGSYILLGDKKYQVKDAVVGYENNGVQYYKFTKNISPAEINDNITIKLFDGIGNQRLDYTTSCKSYLDKLNANTSDENIKNIILSLVDYSYYAQKYFKYNVSNLATPSNNVSNVNISEFDSYKHTLSGKVTGLNYLGSSLIIKNKISMRHYFTLDNSSIGDYTFIIDGQDVKPILKCGNVYYVEIANIMPTKLLSNYNLTVNNGTEKISLTYGVMSYANKLVNSTSSNSTVELLNLVKAIYLYAKAVDTVK